MCYILPPKLLLESSQFELFALLVFCITTVWQAIYMLHMHSLGIKFFVPSQTGSLLLYLGKRIPFAMVYNFRLSTLSTRRDIEVSFVRGGVRNTRTRFLIYVCILLQKKQVDVLKFYYYYNMVKLITSVVVRSAKVLQRKIQYRVFKYLFIVPIQYIMYQQCASFAMPIHPILVRLLIHH